MIIIGIDPGTHGGVAVLDYPRLRVLEAFSLPTVKIKIGRTNRARLDDTSLLDVLQRIKQAHQPQTRDPLLAVLEELNGPNQQDGKLGAWVLSGTYHTIRAMLKALRYRLEYAPPQVWKKALRVPADKGAAVARADEMYPEDRQLWRGPQGGKIDGPAEAAMIARYGGDKWLAPLLGKEAA